jgi:signal transduction histidine kinase
MIARRGDITDTNAAANLNVPGAVLRLPPSYRHLQIDFTAIHLSAPENIRFRYQLVGFDNDWIEPPENERSADYSRLAAADYQFRAQACIGDGAWSESATTLALSVAPFFWRTWWFEVGVLLLFTSSVIAIVRYISFRRLQAEMRQLEQRATLDKERTRIARDLHDDLGCSLNRVALTLEMAQRGNDAPEVANGKLEHCSSLVRQVARSVDEIVWAINPRNDTLHYMVDYISQFTVEFLHAANISCRVDLPDRVPNRLVSPEVRHNLFLVVKEALNNIARHAKASEVRLCITATEEEVAIIIEDNGCGFERAPDNASCDGLRNMRQRMEEIGGNFDLASRPGSGTRVEFVHSWPANTGVANGR